MAKFLFINSRGPNQEIIINYATSVSAHRYYPLTGPDAEFLESVIRNGQWVGLSRAITLSNITTYKEQLKFAKAKIAQISSDVITNSDEAMAANETNINAAAGTATPVGISETAQFPIDGRLDSVNQGPLNQYCIDGQPLFIPHRTVSATASFSDNITKLIEGEAIKSAPSDGRRNIILVPKPDTVAKLFILPEWASDIRGTIESPLYDDQVYTTTDFILSSVNEQDAEKYQIIETFGDNILYFYGERPSVYSFSGNLLNTNNHQWRNNFYRMYKDRFRGTRCVENKTRAYILYEDIIVEGYILNLSMTLSSNETKVVPFSFSMYITNQANVNSKSDARQTIHGVDSALMDILQDKQYA